jgi:hypothetical protein
LKLKWDASDDAGVPEFQGYYVYAAPDMNNPFHRVAHNPTTARELTRSSVNLNDVYIVRAVRLERGSSRTYYNLSQRAHLLKERLL